MKKQRKHKVLVKVMAVIMAAIGSVPFLQGCAKEQKNQTAESSTSGYNDYEKLPTNNEFITETETKKETKTVYLYEKIQDMAPTDLDAMVGKTVNLARNDKYAKDAYSAMENENCINIEYLNFIDETTELTVEAVAGIDKDGKFYINYNNGARNNNDDLAMAILVSYDDINVGWVANDNYHLARDVIYETENMNFDDKLIDEYEVSKDEQISSSYKYVSEPYLYKIR